MKRLLFLILLLFIPLQIQAQGPIYLPLVLKMQLPGYDVNNWRLVQPIEGFNKVLNPSGEIAGNFSDVSGATTSRVTTYSHYGLYSYELVSTGAGDGTQLTTATLANTNHFVTVRVKKPYSTLQVSINSNVKTLQFIEKIDQDWDLLGVAYQPGEANGATAVQILATAAETIYFDGVQLEPLPYWTTYIDGSQKECEWLGASNVSVSRRPSASRLGGKLVDFYEEYKFQIKSIKGAGSSEVSIGVDSYAILPGGELNSVKVEPREFQIKGKFITDDEDDVRYYREELRKAFGFQLTTVNYNGGRVQKSLAGVYSGGLESDSPAFYGKYSIVEDGTYQLHEKWTEDATIEIVAPNPYWYEIGEHSVLLDTDDSATFRTVAGRLRSTGQWDPLGPPGAGGTYTDMEAIAEDETYVYFGGDFTNFDGIANADYIVRYEKATDLWSALGTGMNGVVAALVISQDGQLYASGAFTTAGGGAANRIAVWDPVASTWAALGSGLNNSAFALAIGPDGTIYTGGNFTTAGGGAAVRIAAWDPATSTWAALGSGLDSTCLAIIVNKATGILYAGGVFANAGGSAAAKIASWDGSAWSALSSGMNNNVNALTIGPDNHLYVGGTFTTAGGNTANRIAVWNGTDFIALSSGVNGDVNGLSFGPDNKLWAVGTFTTAGGTTLTLARGLAQWNGSVWAHPDINYNATMYAVLASQFVDPVITKNYDLYVGTDPISGGTANYGGLVTVNNSGTVEAFPQVIFFQTGDASAIIETIRNESTGRELLLDYVLLDGETLVINLSPTNKSVVSSIFGKRFDAILVNSDFGSWSLKPGNNNVTSFVDSDAEVTAYLLWKDTYNGY